MHQPSDYFQEGEIDFGILYRQHAPAVLRYLNARLTIKEDAEDLLVEVFLASLKNPALRKMNAPEQQAWLFRVAHNKLVDHYRLNRQHAGRSSIDDYMETLIDDDVYQLPEQLTLRHEDHANLRTHIGKLNTFQQEVLQLRFAYGMHSSEIGMKLNKKATAIRATLSRTLNTLRSLYEQQEEHD